VAPSQEWAAAAAAEEEAAAAAAMAAVTSAVPAALLLWVPHLFVHPAVPATLPAADVISVVLMAPPPAVLQTTG